MIVFEGRACRLWGIDAWELRGEQRGRGLAAREFAVSMLPEPGGPVLVRSINGEEH